MEESNFTQTESIVGGVVPVCFFTPPTASHHLQFANLLMVSAEYKILFRLAIVSIVL